MPISYSETSSEPELDLGWAYADGNNGIPEKCYCGRVMKIEASTGVETGTPGRKYYICPDWCKEGNGEHIWKWWDEGVTKQICIIQRELREQRETVCRLDRLQAFDPNTEALKEDVKTLKGEVSRLKEQIAKLEEVKRLKGEASRLKKQIAQLET